MGVKQSIVIFNKLLSLQVNSFLKADNGFAKHRGFKCNDPGGKDRKLKISLGFLMSASLKNVYAFLDKWQVVNLAVREYLMKLYGTDIRG